MRTRARYLGGRAVCTGVVPKGTAGQRLVGTETATISGAKASTRFSFAVRK